MFASMLTLSGTELFKRFGKDTRAQKQAIVNAQLAKAVDTLARRDLPREPTPKAVAA